MSSTTALVPSSATKTVSATGTGQSSPASLRSNLSFSLPKMTSTPRAIGSRPEETSSTPQKLGAPGRWQHPRLDEVIRRRSATNFDSSNFKAVAFNVLLIALSLFIPGLLQRIVPLPWLYATYPYPNYALYALRVLFAANIGLSLTPLFRKPDACEDVPLTPSQRQLLGLPPMTRPATPQEQEQYVTPPRFARSATPRSSSSSLFAEAGNSPLAGRGTPLDISSASWQSSSSTPLGSARSRTGSGPHSPLASAFRGEMERNRPSYNSGRSSPFNSSEFDAAGSVPTPTKGTRASVGLNNKWLYEKGRGSPKASPSRGSLFS